MDDQTVTLMWHPTVTGIPSIIGNLPITIAFGGLLLFGLGLTIALRRRRVALVALIPTLIVLLIGTAAGITALVMPGVHVPAALSYSPSVKMYREARVVYPSYDAYAFREAATERWGISHVPDIPPEELIAGATAAVIQDADGKARTCIIMPLEVTVRNARVTLLCDGKTLPAKQHSATVAP